jgi:3-dehydroquinate synthetase
MNTKILVPQPNQEYLNLNKKQIRLIKNRVAADLSRKRKKEQFENMERMKNQLEIENEELKKKLEFYKELNRKLLLENIQLKTVK